MKINLTAVLKKSRGFYEKHRKPVLIGGGALGLVIILMIVLSLTVFKKETATTQTVALARGDLTQTIEVVGAVRAVPSATLTWATAGIVMPFTARVGDTVKGGDTILELEPSSVSSEILQAQSDLITAKNDLTLLETADTDYQTASQTLTDAESTYDTALVDFNSINENSAPIASLETIIDQYFAAREAYWEAQASYEATGSLADTDQKRVDAKSAMDEAQKAKETAFHKVTNSMGIYFGNTQEDTYIEYRAAKAALDEARVAWNAARDNSDEIAAAEANVQALENTINGSRIIAPFDGSVTDIHTAEGDHVSSGADAIQLDNLSTLVVDVTISEVDINIINVGDAARITFDAIANKTYNGIVSQVGDSGTEDSGVVKFNVTVTITDADEQVKPGFTAVTTIITDQVTDALLVPVAAIRTINNQKMVIVMRNGIPTPVPVTLGTSSDIYSALVSGNLQVGDLVVITLDTSSSSGFGFMGGGILRDGGIPGGDRQPSQGGQPPSGN
ncbi:MAG: efflux RND transporter periplasmic adaptor subunit [Anaerolineaceae bacterium]